MAVTIPPRAPSIPEKEALRDNPHLYESFKKIEQWMNAATAFMAAGGTAGATGPPGPPGSDGGGNVDGGTPTSVYGGVSAIDGGVP